MRTPKAIKLFRNAIAFRFWHHFGKPHGTAIRWMGRRPGLFGVLIKEGGLHIGLWWQVRFEMLAVHAGQF